MANFINVAFLVLNSFMATFFAGIYLLNLFKKKTILERIDMYGDSSRSFSFWASLFSGLIGAGYYVQEPDKLYGFSLGAMINGMVIILILGIIIIDAVETWFKSLPET